MQRKRAEARILRNSDAVKVGSVVGGGSVLIAGGAGLADDVALDG